MAQIDFAYPLGYEILSMDEFIPIHAAENFQKNDFEATSKAEHLALFSQIVNSIQSGGKNLGEIYYSSTDGNLSALLNEKEVIHLQDVANLVDKFYATGLAAMVICIGLVMSARKNGVKLPSRKDMLTGFGCVTLSSVMIFSIIGFQNIFYWLHTIAFPDGHQWFFYYHESLMATLMKAPDIFAYIAVLLLGLTAFFLWVSLYLLRAIFRQR